MRRALLTVGLSVALATASADAGAEPASGDDLLWVCDHYGCDKEITLLTEVLIRDQRARVPYTAGFDPVCIGPEVTWPQVVTAVQQGLRAHPEALHQDVHGLVLAYLAAAFPCSPA
jgi:hypothetical protein